jgi:predicted ester cyclase
MTKEEQNFKLFQSADDAYNAHDLETFAKRHKPNVLVRIPGAETHGIDPHLDLFKGFIRAFPDGHMHNRPYRVSFASGDWVCTIARFTGTMTGPMTGPDGKEIPPTGKSFDVEACTVARWEDGQIVEENVFYDQATRMKQRGRST